MFLIEGAVLKVFGESKWKKYKQFFGSFRHLSTSQIDYIVDTINEGIKTSEESLELVIREKDKLKEKDVIISVFNNNGRYIAKAGKEIDADVLDLHLDVTTRVIVDMMKKEVKYYADKITKEGAENAYKCHLELTTSKIAKHFLNNAIPS